MELHLGLALRVDSHHVVLEVRVPTARVGNTAKSTHGHVVPPVGVEALEIVAERSDRVRTAAVQLWRVLISLYYWF